MYPIRSTPIILLLAVMACGAPGTDSVFTKTLPGRGNAAPAVDTAPRPAAPRTEIKAFAGMYRREGTDSRFQPCGTTTALEVTGSGEGRYLLAERFRWNSMWQGQRLFAVLRGAIVSDTVPGEGADSLKPVITRKFFVVGVDSMRIWERDCNNMRVR